MIRAIYRMVAMSLVMLGLFVMVAPQASGITGIPLRVHVQESDQYLYTTLMVPIDVYTLQSALPLAAISFDGQPVTVQTSTVDTAGIWQLAVSSPVELQAGNSAVRLYDGANIVPLFDIALPMHLVPRSPGNLSPTCDAVMAVLSGMHTACQASFEDATIVVIPEDPGPVDPPVVEPPAPQPQSAPRPVVEPVAEPLSQPAPVTPQQPEVPKPTPKSSPVVLSQSTDATPAPPQPTAPSASELTPVTAVVSVAAGIAVAGAGALIVNKLGINKPKL